MNRTSAVTTDFVIGRDLGRAGQLVRALAGLLNLAAALSSLSLMRPVSGTDLVLVGLAALAVALAYTVLVAAIGERLVAHIDPWLAAFILVLPLAILVMLPFVPVFVTVGAFLFIAISMFVQAAIRYGGCEVAGIPTLLLRKRYTVYCALNSADLVERWLRSRPRWVAWLFALLAFAATMALVVVAEAIGQAAGFFAAYLAFLAVGFAAGRIVSRRALGT